MTNSRLPNKITYDVGIMIGAGTKVMEKEDYPDWILRILLEIFIETASPFYYTVMVDDCREIFMDIKIKDKYVLVENTSIAHILEKLETKPASYPYVATYKLFPENYYEST